MGDEGVVRLCVHAFPRRTSTSIYGRFASIEAAAIAGLLFAVLTLVSVTLLLRLPDASSASDIASFYDDPDERRLDLLALNLAAFSAIAFLWFIAVIRRRIGTREDRFFATVFLGSGLVYVGLMLAAAMMLTAPSVGIDFGNGIPPGQHTYSTVIGFGFGLLLSVILRVQAIFVFTTSTLILRTRVLHGWVPVIGYVTASVLIIMPILTRPAGFAFPIWVAVVSLALLIRRHDRIESINRETPGTQPHT